MKLKSLISSEPETSRWNKKKNKDIQITFKAGFGEDFGNDDDEHLAIGSNTHSKKTFNKNQGKNRFNKKEKEELDLLLDKRNKGTYLLFG
jgi:hypothetical protein